MVNNEHPGREEIKERIELLTKVEIFSGTDPALLGEIAEVVRDLRIRKGQKVFQKHDEGDALYIIKSGVLRVHDGNRVISRMTAGQVFGEYALFDSETRSASVTADEHAELLELSLSDFYRVMANKTDVIRGVLRKVIRRIREMNELETKLAKSYLKIRRQKEEIGKQHEDILAQKEELEEKNRILQELNDKKNHLVSVVSHGLRNPLTSSLCVMDLLETEEESLTDQQKEYIKLIHSGLRRMNSMINQTLDVDIIQLRRIKLKKEKINLAEVFGELRENFRYTLSIKKLALNCNLQDLYIDADRNFIYVVFDNLLSNAVRFSPPGKSIYVSMEREGNEVKTTVKDEGPGISDTALLTLFDKPQIHERPADRSGLLIAKKYVEVMNGRIFLESKTATGTTFTVLFPEAVPEAR